MCALRLAGNKLRVDLAHCPKTAGMGSKTATTLVGRSTLENGWMNGLKKKYLQHNIHCCFRWAEVGACVIDDVTSPK